MPAFVTHIFFGELVSQELQGSLQACVRSQPAAYFWGVQGPDLLFFRDAVRGKSQLPAIGGVMHCKKTGQLFATVAHYIEHCAGENERQSLTAYFMGFLCHYYMDTVTHPYIYFLQEQKRRYTSQEEQGGIHHLIESDIDTAIYRFIEKKSVRRFHISKELQGDTALYAAVEKLYLFVLQEVYGIAVEKGEIARCFTDTRYLVSALLEPTGLLLPVVQLAERYVLHRPNSLSAHIRRSRTYEDILNQRHRGWHHLQTPNMQEHLSFMDLVQQAKEQALEGLHQWYGCIQYNETPVVEELPSFDNGAPQQDCAM